jgi:hypothetical protein
MAKSKVPFKDASIYMETYKGKYKVAMPIYVVIKNVFQKN